MDKRLVILAALLIVSIALSESKTNGISNEYDRGLVHVSLLIYIL